MEAELAGSTAPGRPPEIEEIANRLWVHPASKGLVDLLVQTALTPNQVSAAGVFAAAGAAVSFATLRLPWAPIVGLGWLFVWHVLDGADGDLARRTKRTSPTGELIDGVCDHVSQALIYVSLAFVLQRSLGGWAWVIATAAALSHTLQANAYEAGRKTYRHWVYGAVWMRQRPDLSRSWAGIANRLYLNLASLFSPNERVVEIAMSRQFSLGPAAMAAARTQYRTRAVRLVKYSGVLGSTGRSLAIVASLLVGSPLWFFLYEILILNAVVVGFIWWRRRVNNAVGHALGGFGAEL